MVKVGFNNFKAFGENLQKFSDFAGDELDLGGLEILSISTIQIE